MSRQQGRRRGWITSLRVQLIVFLTVALLPLGSIAVFQTARITQEAQRLADRDLLVRTRQAASAQEAVLQRAIGAAQALGRAASRLAGDRAACSGLLSDFVAARPEFGSMAFLTPDGATACHSNGDARDVVGRPDWARFIANPVTTVTAPRTPSGADRSGFVVFTPVFDARSGALLGGQSVSIPRHLDGLLLDAAFENVELAMVTAGGEVVAGSAGFDAVAGPGGLDLTPGAAEIPRRGLVMERAGAADPAAPPTAILPLVAGQLYLVGLWTGQDPRPAVSLFGWAVPLLPLAMWLASLVVAYISVNTLVLRHLSRLGRRMRRYRAGDHRTHVTLRADAPDEIREIADSYNDMMMRIAADQATLEDSLREKDLLLRELHHRVKNNLQLIASIVNMHMREVTDEGARQVLRGVQDRVMNLSSIHRALYTDSALNEVRADHILGEIVSRLSDLGLPTESAVEVDSDLAPIMLDPDQAVPLSLLTAEAVTNAAKYVGTPPVGPPRISLSLTEEGEGEILFRAVNTCGGETGPPGAATGGTGMGARLIRAFASQLGGHAEFEMDAHSYALSVRFTRRQPG
jgi:two-component sensor histidine kinase